jgi:hypothetical protein
MSASWYSAESFFFLNLWSPGVIGGHNRVKHFFNGENLWKSFQKPTEPKKVQIHWQGYLMAIKKSNIACVHRRNISQYDSGERCGPWASCLSYTFNFIYSSGGSICEHTRFTCRYKVVSLNLSRVELQIFKYVVIASSPSAWYFEVRITGLLDMTLITEIPCHSRFGHL